MLIEDIKRRIVTKVISKLYKAGIYQSEEEGYSQIDELSSKELCLDDLKLDIEITSQQHNTLTRNLEIDLNYLFALYDEKYKTLRSIQQKTDELINLYLNNNSSKDDKFVNYYTGEDACYCNRDAKKIVLPIANTRNNLVSKTGTRMGSINITHMSAVNKAIINSNSPLYAIDTDEVVYWNMEVYVDEPINIKYENIDSGFFVEFEVVLDYPSTLNEIKLDFLCEYPIMLKKIWIDDTTGYKEFLTDEVKIDKHFSIALDNMLVSRVKFLINQIHYTKEQLSYTKPKIDSIFNVTKDNADDLVKEETVTEDKLKYQIGINNIGFMTHAYSRHGVFLSKPIELEYPVAGVMLKTKEKHVYDSDGNKLTDIKYKLIINNGEVVVDIQPDKLYDLVKLVPAKKTVDKINTLDENNAVKLSKPVYLFTNKQLSIAANAQIFESQFPTEKPVITIDGSKPEINFIYPHPQYEYRPDTINCLIEGNILKFDRRLSFSTMEVVYNTCVYSLQLQAEFYNNDDKYSNITPELLDYELILIKGR